MNKRFATLLNVMISAAVLAAPGRLHAQAPSDSTLQALAEMRDRLDGIDETLSTLGSDVSALKKLKVSGYIQARYERHYDSMSRSDSSGATLNRDDFFIRRGRVKFTYTPGPASQYVLYFDGARATVSLKEAYVKLIEPWTGRKVSLTLGQQNVPFGYEIERSSSVRELPERSRAERTLFPDERDRGARLTVPVHRRLTLTTGVWNGPGITDRVAGVNFAGRDNDTAKDVTGRAAVALGWLDFGGSAYSGVLHVPTKSGTGAAAEPRRFTRNRYGLDAQTYFEVPRLGGGSLKAECYWAKDVAFPKNLPPAGVDQLGWYVMAVQNLGENLQAAGRVDRFDPDTDSGDNATTTWTGGLNYFWDSNTRITLAYDHPVQEGNNPKDDFVTLQLQLVY